MYVKLEGNCKMFEFSEGFELNCSGDIDVQLYFCRSKALTQGSTRCVQDYTFFLYLTYFPRPPMFQK